MANHLRRLAPRARQAFFSTAAALLAAALVAAGTGMALAAAPAAQVGKPAPDFTLQLLDGKKVTLSSFKGKPVVLNFWHSG